MENGNKSIGDVFTPTSITSSTLWRRLLLLLLLW